MEIKGKFKAALSASAIIVMALTACEAALNISLPKDSFYRYELIPVSVESDSSYREMGELEAFASLVRGDLPVELPGRLQDVRLSKYSEGVWKGYIPVPWNPELGIYSICAEIMGPDSLVYSEGKIDLEIEGRQPPELGVKGLCVMTIESTVDILQKSFPDPVDGVRRKGSFARWANFLGADAVWYSAGQTIEGWGEVTDSSPWYETNVKIFPKVAERVHNAGFKFGGWIGCYFLWGEKLKDLSYTYSLDYWKPSGRMYHPHRVSISDPKRFNDILELVKKLDSDPNVDYIGLDYIRTGFGGYEMVDDFVREMDIKVPKRWDQMSFGKKARWLALKIEIEKPFDIVDRWNWWRAHSMATIVNDLIVASGSKKPWWVFMLGWEHGYEHGQDPVMFNDAGVTACAVMLYESNAEHCRQMNKSWPNYIRKGQVNLLIGESIDWDLLQKSLDPPGPAEFYRRMEEAMDSFYLGDPLEGVFSHDLSRACFGNCGPYPRIEWAIAGASIFSKVKYSWGRIPLKAEITVDDEVRYGIPFPVRATVYNGSAEAKQVDLSLFAGDGLEIVGNDFAELGDVKPGEGRTVEFRCRIVKTASDRRSKFMVAVTVNWGSQSPKDKFVTFAYVGCKS